MPAMGPITTFRQKIALAIFGLFLFALVIEIGLRITGFVYLFLQEQRNITPFSQDGVYRIICVGESTTAMGGNDSYPSQLEKILNQKFPHTQFKVINKGLPGVDTNAIVSQARHYLNVYKPDMVIAMMGINDDANPYPKRGEYFFEIKKFIEALRTYKLAKLLSLRLREPSVLKDLYFKQGRYYLEIERYREAEEMFNKARELVPSDAMAYIGLGCVYEKQGMNSLAGKVFKEAEVLASDNAQVYLELGAAYYDKPVLAEEMFRKAIKLNPKNYQPYCDLAQLYQNISRLEEAEEVFKQAIAVAPDKMETYLLLGWFYYEHGMPLEAEDMFTKAIEKDKGDLITYRELGYVKQSQGKHKEAEPYFAMSKPLAEYVKRITRHNYRVLKDTVLKKGLKLVCVQYPMRNVNDLREIVGSGDGILFVDNETAFRDALRKGKYEDFFKDRFGGDFGHCTPEGNRLLANNIAETLIKEYFSKKK